MTDKQSVSVLEAELPPLPADRTPCVTVVLFQADRANLSARLLEVAAQDYQGPIEVLAIAERDRRPVVDAIAELPWAICPEETAAGSAALELALRLSSGDVIACLSSDAHPHALWLDACVADLVSRDDRAIAVPALMRSSGVLLAAGARVRTDGGFEGNTDAPPGDEALLDLALGDGLVCRKASLERLLPFESGLDLRGLGLDLTLRAKPLGLRVGYTPSARVVLAAKPAQRGGKRVTMDERSELYLVARHQPDALARVMGRMSMFASAEHAGTLDALREALRRAGLDSTEGLMQLLQLGLGNWAQRAAAAEETADALRDRSSALDAEYQQTLVTLHREMAWAHSLNQRTHELETAVEREREKSTAEFDRARRELEREKDTLAASLRDAESRAAVAQLEVQAAMAARAGQQAVESRVVELEQRWRDAEHRREVAEREAAVAQVRLRAIEETRTQNDQLRREEAERRTAAEAAALATREQLVREQRERAVERAALEAAAAEAKEAAARIASAEVAFNGASSALASSQRDLDELRARVAEIEGRRDAAERALAEAQTELDVTRRASAQRAAEMSRTIEERETALTAQTETAAEQIETLRGDLDVAVASRTALENVATEQRLALDALRAQANADADRLRELIAQMDATRRALGDAEASVLRERGERYRVAEELAQQRTETHRIVEEKHQESARAGALEAERDAGLAREKDLRTKIELQRFNAEAAAARHREAMEAAAAAGTLERAEAGKRLQAQIELMESARVEFESRLAAASAEMHAVRTAAAARAHEQEEKLRRADEHVAALRSETAALLAEIAKLAAELHQLHGENANLHHALHEERVHAARLDAERRTLAERLDATARTLDATRSALAERTADLAMLRRETLDERDALTAHVTSLLEEVTQRRWRTRPLTPDERAFLTGPGASFVTRPLPR